MNRLEVFKPSDEKDLHLLKGFLLTPENRQFYGNKQDIWVEEKALPRIENGEASALLSVVDGAVMGDVVWYDLADGSREVKNFRIDPEFGNRALGFFTLTQLKHEPHPVTGTSPTELTLDTTVTNLAAVDFFTRFGFVPFGTPADLYDTGNLEQQYRLSLV
jgi:ribosomal protein S18 acetylase RimI-like enzyme